MALVGSARGDQVEDSLTAIVDQLSKTTPEVVNTVEWAEVRLSCRSVRDLVKQGHVDAAMDILLSRLSEIEPHVDTVVEWREIRETCNALKLKKQTKSKLIGLLARFAATKPAFKNASEWQDIRRVAERELLKLLD
jgi:hypothetical protein